MASKDTERERNERRTTPSGLPIDPVYRPDPDRNYEGEIGDPGEFPFTRGVYPRMYLERPWTIRQYSGFGTAEDTNKRYRDLLREGQTGLSVAFDLPTQLGLDSDDDSARHDIGRVGVAVDSIEDFRMLFKDLPLDSISTSFTINATAPIILAMYLVVAEHQGVKPSQISGTLQNDILKEFAARGAWIYPVDHSLRLVCDVIEYSCDHMPRFNPISIAGAHFRDAGASAVQEAAFTLSDAKAYTRELLARGLDVDHFAPRLSFYFYTYTDLFEEVAKYRAMRRTWAHIMRDEFGATDPKSMMFRFGVVCGGKSLTRQQPVNNVVRVAYGALASVLGGVQSMFTAAYDEAYSIPTEETAVLALRTQQILLHETGVASTVDPLAGSYFVESLTDDFEHAMRVTMEEIEHQGGMAQCVEDGTIQRMISSSAYDYERRVQGGDVPVVGVNRYATDAAAQLDLYRYDSDIADRQVAQLEELRRTRDSRDVRLALDEVATACKDKDQNVMPSVINAVRAFCTVGEISEVMREVFGDFREPAVI